MQRLNEAAEDAFGPLRERVFEFIQYMHAVRADFVTEGMLPMDEITAQFIDDYPDSAARIINAALDFVAGMDGWKLRDPPGG